jgi:hypothetical protein
MSIFCNKIAEKTVSENRLATIDWRPILAGTQDSSDVWTGEILTGTPTASVVNLATGVDDSTVTISNVSVSTAILASETPGDNIPIACGVQCLIAGGTAGIMYGIVIAAATTSSPAQAERRGIKVQVLAD